MVVAATFCVSVLADGSTNSPAAPALRVTDNYLVAIPKSGLGKDYQFAASLIPQQRAPTSTGLQGKIVRFELFPDGVDMYESTAGLVVTEDLPARRLLATFPIVRQDADRVVVDFNKGMHRVFTQAWTSAGELDLGQRDVVLEVPEGRVFDVQEQDGQLVIRQSVQIRSRDYNANLEARYEARYFISPYVKGAFESKEPQATDDRYVKYFETEGKIEEGTGRVSARVARFDVSHPVIFYYSANTPADYVNSVRDGVLYWNRSFGKEIVQVRKAPDGVTAPDSRYNIIQWVPWDNAGSAYADVLLDPLSGQSEHGQAYITSVFAFASRASARALLRTMTEATAPKAEPKKNPANARFGLPFLSAPPVCEAAPVEFAQQMASSLAEVLASDNLTDEAVLRISQDYVREVVAHEVGHILGLRHNFAGSLAATLTQKELDDWFTAFVAGQPLDTYTNKITANSVMEYNVFKSAVFIGWLISNGRPALPHDQAAITWGYFDNNDVRDKKMLFATDDDIGRYGDVRTFDYGTNPVVSAYCNTAQIITYLPNNVIETFIRARAPRNPKDRIPLEQVNLSCKMYASQLAAQFADILTWFRADTRSFRIESQFDYIGDLNEKERMQAHWKSLNAQLDELGGVDRAVFSFVPADLKLDTKSDLTNTPVVTRVSSKDLSARLEKLLDSTNYATFVGLDDKKYSFTKEERELIVKRAKTFFEELEKEIIKQVCLRLTNSTRDLGSEANGSVGEDDAVSKLEQRIIDLAKYVITTKDETNHIEGKVDKAHVQVTEYLYDMETRLAAAKALSEKGSFKGWAEDAKLDIRNQLKGDVEGALNLEHFKDFKTAQLSRPLRDWYQRQQDILGLLPVPGPPPAAGPATAPAAPSVPASDKKE